MKLRLLIGVAELTILLALGGEVRAQGLAELGATTAIQGTLAGNAASGAQGTLRAVKTSLAASQARTSAAWKSAGGPGDHGSGGAAKGWATARSASSGGRTGVAKGWAIASSAASSPAGGHGWAKAGGDTRQAALRR